jgi:hypothetical protein
VYPGAYQGADPALLAILDNSETQIDHSHPGGDPGSSLDVRSTIRAGIDQRTTVPVGWLYDVGMLAVSRNTTVLDRVPCTFHFPRSAAKRAVIL